MKKPSKKRFKRVAILPAKKSTKSKSKAKAKSKAKVVKKVVKVKKLSVTKAKPMKKQAPVARPSIALNAPTTKEQQAGIPAVISGDSFEGVKRIDNLPLTQQIDTVFNPLHTITRTTVTDAVSDSTFIVTPTPTPVG
jgi:hypothetical protein